MIVVDASAVLEVLLVTPAAERISECLFVTGETLQVPHLIDLEVAQVLRRYLLSRELTSERGLQAPRDPVDFPLTRYPHDLFLPRTWELRHNLTAYAAAYVALAQALDAPLVTRDRSLPSSAGHKARVEDAGVRASVFPRATSRRGPTRPSQRGIPKGGGPRAIRNGINNLRM